MGLFSFYESFPKYTGNKIGFASIFKENERDAAQVSSLEKSNLEFRLVDSDSESTSIIQRDLALSDSEDSCNEKEALNEVDETSNLDSESQSDSSVSSSDNEDENIVIENDITSESSPTTFLDSSTNSNNVCNASERPSTSSSISSGTFAGSSGSKLVTTSDFIKRNPNNTKSVWCKLCLLGN